MSGKFYLRLALDNPQSTNQKTIWAQCFTSFTSKRVEQDSFLYEDRKILNTEVMQSVKELT